MKNVFDLRFKPLWELELVSDSAYGEEIQTVSRPIPSLPIPLLIWEVSGKSGESSILSQKVSFFLGYPLRNHRSESIVFKITLFANFHRSAKNFKINPNCLFHHIIWFIYYDMIHIIRYFCIPDTQFFEPYEETFCATNSDRELEIWWIRRHSFRLSVCRFAPIRKKGF